MNFRPDLAEKVLRGEKTVTRRIATANPRSPWWEGGCSLRVGRSYAVCPGRGKPAIGRLVVIAVRRERLGHPSDHEARLEGFDTYGAFVDTFATINGQYDCNAQVWRIAFRPQRAESGHSARRHDR